MPFPTTPVLPRPTGESNIVVGVPGKKIAPRRPVQHLPENKGRSPPARGALPARNHAPTHRRTGSLWTPPHRCGQRGQTGSSVGGVDPHTGVLTYVACRDDGTSTTVQTNALASLDKMTVVKRATRRGKTRTGGCRSCTLTVWFLFAATLLMVDVVGAVFAPADRAALKAAVGTCTRSGSDPNYVYTCTGGCLGETADGSCPIASPNSSLQSSSIRRGKHRPHHVHHQ